MISRNERNAKQPPTNTGVTAFGEERLGMLPRVLRRVFEHVAAAERDGTCYQVSNLPLATWMSIRTSRKTDKHDSNAVSNRSFVLLASGFMW